MKRILIVLLIISIGILLSACGGGAGDASSDAASVQQKIALSWVAPTTRTDGSPLALSDLEGYRIYYGTSPDDLILQEEIIGVSETVITISLATPGVYYFAVTAYDADGLESSFSEIVSKDVS